VQKHSYCYFLPQVRVLHTVRGSNSRSYCISIKCCVNMETSRLKLTRLQLVCNVPAAHLDDNAM
jgi:hypothetical protein